MMKKEYCNLWDSRSTADAVPWASQCGAWIFFNKQMEHTNACHETFIAEHVANDHVTLIGGVMGVDINRGLLISC